MYSVEICRNYCWMISPFSVQLKRGRTGTKVYIKFSDMQLLRMIEHCRPNRFQLLIT